ncbi:MAG: AmmeMemoRadiSam system protein B [Planctomycetota bacterium]|jgi:AmmeMemoRadiSam system protein B
MTDLNSLPEHIRRPQLRPIQPIPVKKDGQKLVALRDPTMLSQQTMIVPPQALMVLQQFRGERPLEEIAAQFQADVGQFAELARGLDRVGLLWGPTAEQLEEQQKARIRESGAFPAGAAASMGDDADACRSRMSEYFNETEDPELDGAVLGVVAPHLDYDRGWPNYAAAYYMLRDMPAPDRVIVLGTNHFGIGDGAVVTEHGFDTPLGRCPVAADLLNPLTERLGKALTIDQLDHLGEHSIQLQLPWLQYCFGNIPLLAALVPDPLEPPIEDDGERVDADRFTEALREVLGTVDGRTLIVASCDLSHVGPQFGEPRAIDQQRRVDVEQHDRDMLAKFITGDAEEFVGALRWNHNPTRWCSIGSMTAMLKLLEPEAIELIDYRQAYDEKGTALVSSAALLLM